MKRMNRFPLFVVVVACLCCWKCDVQHNKKPLVTIAGTVVSLSPPEGFVPVPALGGFKHEKLKATIMVVETPRTFSMVSQEIGSAKNGMTLISKEKVDMQGKEATLYQLNKKSEMRNFNQWMLVFANNRHTTSVTGTYLAKDEEALSDNIKEALLTTHIAGDESALITVVPFEVSLNEAPLKLAKVLAGPALVYTADGVWSDSSLLANSFYVGRSIPQGSSLQITEEFVRSHMSSLCASCEVDSTSINNVVIDNLKGIELWAYTKDTHKLKYQVLLHEDDHYFLMVGTAGNDQAQNIDRFRTISRTFKRRSPSGTKA